LVEQVIQQLVSDFNWISFSNLKRN
jgi:hypothetical protein